MARHEFTQTYTRPRRHLEEAIHVALEQLGYEERRDADGDIVATAGMSWSSWGEDIEIELDETPASTSVTYRSLNGIQLFDWGKSRQNVAQLAEEVERRLAS